jgi:hypothetical protein
MCDKCACTSFSPHLWKAGECRECHHSISEHALVPVPATDNNTIQNTETTQRHSFVGKLSVDKLEPFSQELNPLTAISSVGRARTSLIIPNDQSGARLSVNYGSRESSHLQPSEVDAAINTINTTNPTNARIMRRSASFKAVGEVDTTTTYEQRLSASYRKSREIKRKSLSEIGGDTAKAQHRAMIIDELVVTERDYCRDLDYLTQVHSL